MKKIVVLVLVYALLSVLVVLAVACAPTSGSYEEPGNTVDTGSARAGQPSLIISRDGVPLTLIVDDEYTKNQVFRFQDGDRICYITMNSYKYMSAGIWCTP
jgi:hypothetical protein